MYSEFLQHSVRIGGGNVLDFHEINVRLHFQPRKRRACSIHQIQGYFNLFCADESFQSLKAFHLSRSREMLRYSGYHRLLKYAGCVLIQSQSLLFLFSLYRELHMLSRACLVFCSINRKHSFLLLLLLLSPPGACPLSLLQGTFCTLQSSLRVDSHVFGEF